MSKDDQLLNLLADTFDLSVKDKDFKKKLMAKLKDDKTIPDALKKTASSIITSTVSESVKTMKTFKEIRERINEAMSTTMTTTDYYKPRPANTDFNRDGVSDQKQDRNKDGHIDGDLNRDGKVDAGYRPDYDLADDGTTDDIYGNLIGDNDSVIDDILDNIEHIEHLIDLDAYDEDELHIVNDNGQHIGFINPGIIDRTYESVERLDEVLSRMARVKMAMKFHQTQSKREAKLKVALRTKSSPAKIAERARHAAINAFKLKMAKKPLNTLSIPEKERIEQMVSRKRDAITKLANKLVPKIKGIEAKRLSGR